MIFLAAVGVYGVENQVGVDMIFVHVNTNHGLVFRQVILCKFPGDLQRLFRRYLPRLE